MRLLDGDDERLGFIAPAALRRFLALDVGLMDAAREIVRDEDVRFQRSAVTAKLQHDVDALVDEAQQFLDDVVLHVGPQEAKALEHAQLALNRAERAFVNQAGIDHVLHLFGALVVEQAPDPVAAQAAMNRVQARPPAHRSAP